MNSTVDYWIIMGLGSLTILGTWQYYIIEKIGSELVHEGWSGQFLSHLKVGLLTGFWAPYLPLSALQQLNYSNQNRSQNQ